ncbi:MFS transporter [Sphaerochaeta halotolerans]|jgi:OFA family oxalate/formate antiporter-like MFS transporter|uniref:MFS transporter n=1 Tax=Sphaerochaeta halotolerans TaxID=2293840 RepID=A0A372ML87_9SPIR|nr:MFS transporter [Sphaerochaeta halotolerans]MBG0767312.1 MFS transporter [Spirochaetaceae bacterium]MDK2860135.1 transporter, family, oxalate/formate antiporter [Sphaerochaeta sp.]MDN5333362.1 transporter, family, oxalate/formate antiporter [Sphaerochaeta sp.]MXI86864.1 MFS transporter [Sphaerochaeta halotolerans]RFU96173.1 MFS transporter [Sphaerochaeta halotolerans]
MHNRWIVLIAGLIMQTILGGIYAWSTLTPWLAESYGISNGESGFVFGLSIAVFTLVMVYSGHLLARKGPRIPALIGALLYLAGYFLASRSHGSFPLLLLAVGVIAGSGIGFAYVVPLSVGMQWFPRQKGLITGLSVGGFGGGAIILSSCIEAGKLSGISLDRFFLFYSLISGSLLFFASLLLSSPPASTGKELGEMQVHQNVKKPMLLSILGMFSGTFAGLLLVGNLAPYALSKGLVEEMTVLSVVLFSVGNLSGRIIWGHIFDKTGYRVIPWSLLLASLFYMLLRFASGGFVFLASVLVLGFLFGSQFVLYAGYLSRAYGVEAFSKRYPLVFLSYGLAGIIAPGVGGWIADSTGSYNPAITLCLVLLFISGLVLFTANRKH